MIFIGVAILAWLVVFWIFTPKSMLGKRDEKVSSKEYLERYTDLYKEKNGVD